MCTLVAAAGTFNALVETSTLESNQGRVSSLCVDCVLGSGIGLIASPTHCNYTSELRLDSLQKEKQIVRNREGECVCVYLH